MKNRPFFVIIFIILILFSSFPALGQPDALKVKEEVNKLARELNLVPKEYKSNPFTQFFVGIIKGLMKIISFLRKLGPVITIPIILLIIFIAGFIGLRFFSIFRKERDRKRQSPGLDGRAGETMHLYVQEAEDLAKNNKYGEALVLLHRGSIHYLQYKKILLAVEYHTNNEIRKELQRNKEYFDIYYKPFSTLAVIAERKTFRADVISPEMFRESLEMYKKNFLC
ncbi:MAG: hypothetical protein JXB88_14465 [Spirochaetales bacterium]|nr:hypothetical protein [Spirochaetales bacterium]